jgi:starvation-inducible DNA-binding protein
MATNRVGLDLQDTLVELTDLALQAKQAHWNVTGPRFLPLHEHLDAMTAQLRAGADEVAERAATIGYPPDGRSSTVANGSPLPVIPGGPLADGAVVDLVVQALDIVTERVRIRVERLSDLDQASQDVLIDVLRGLDKQRWTFTAQRA